MLSVMVRIWPDWTPADRSLPKTVIAKISSLVTIQMVMKDSRVMEGIDDSEKGMEKMQQGMKVTLTEVNESYKIYLCYNSVFSVFCHCELFSC